MSRKITKCDQENLPSEWELVSNGEVFPSIKPDKQLLYEVRLNYLKLVELSITPQISNTVETITKQASKVYMIL